MALLVTAQETDGMAFCANLITQALRKHTMTRIQFTTVICQEN